MQKQNKRVLLTKRMIKDALIELMDKKDISKITISDVCSIAEVNRSTFYSHYKDIGEVLTDAEDDIIAKLPKVNDQKQDLRGAIRSILEFVKENSELVSIMVIKRTDDGFMKKLLNSVLSLYEHLSPEIDGEKTRINYIFCTSGIVGIVKFWITSNFAMDIDTFTDIALTLAVKVTS